MEDVQYLMTKTEHETKVMQEYMLIIKELNSIFDEAQTRIGMHFSHSVIRLSAMIEYLLEKAISKKLIFPELFFVENYQERMSLAALMNLALAIEALPDWLRVELKEVANLRNRYAHNILFKIDEEYVTKSMQRCINALDNSRYKESDDPLMRPVYPFKKTDVFKNAIGEEKVKIYGTFIWSIVFRFALRTYADILGETVEHLQAMLGKRNDLIKKREDLINQKLE